MILCDVMDSRAVPQFKEARDIGTFLSVSEAVVGGVVAGRLLAFIG